MSGVLRALLGPWHLEPVPVLAALVAVTLYLRGAAALGPEGRPSRWQAAAFAGGVLALLVALLSPLDDLAGELQWAHMSQHLLLLMVGPGLVVLGRPLGTALAGLPPTLGRALRNQLRPRLTGGAARGLSLLAAAAAFTVTMWVWHLPRLYDATLANQGIHDLEHTTFLLAGLVFWAPIADRASWTGSLGHVGRAALCLSGLVTSWMLAVYIGYSPAVLYTYSGGYGVSALADQQLASGVMWIPGSVPFLVALTGLLIGWFEADDRSEVAPAPVSGATPLGRPGVPG